MLNPWMLVIAAIHNMRQALTWSTMTLLSPCFSATWETCIIAWASLTLSVDFAESFLASQGIKPSQDGEHGSKSTKPAKCHTMQVTSSFKYQDTALHENMHIVTDRYQYCICTRLTALCLCLVYWITIYSYLFLPDWCSSVPVFAVFLCCNCTFKVKSQMPEWIPWSYYAQLAAFRPAHKLSCVIRAHWIAAENLNAKI